MKPTLTTFNDIADSIGKYHADPAAYKGKSTGIRKLDELVTIKEGNLHIITGIPSSGKSELLDQIMLNTIALHNWHWTVFSPENWPLESHFSKLAEKWTGRPWTKQGDISGITPDELAETRDFLAKSIAFADVPEGMMSLDALIEATKDSDKMNCTNALLLDPWNELDGKLPTGITETNHISACLSTLRNFARKSEIAVFIVAHPTKLQKKEDGNYPVPTPYDINGSAAWRNKGDVCISVWRDYALNDGVVQVHVQKIRNKMLGKLGMAELHWTWTNGLFMSEKINIADGVKYAIKTRVV